MLKRIRTSQHRQVDTQKRTTPGTMQSISGFKESFWNALDIGS
jgi:hypothetical protein